MTGKIRAKNGRQRVMDLAAGIRMVHPWNECGIGATECFRIRQTSRDEDISPGSVAGKLFPPVYANQPHRSAMPAGADLNSVPSGHIHLNAPKSGSPNAFPTARSSKTAISSRMRKSGRAGGFGNPTTGSATGPRASSQKG